MPFKYATFGSYLVYSENNNTVVKGSSFSSWEIRNQWNRQMHIDIEQSVAMARSMRSAEHSAADLQEKGNSNLN